MDPKAPHFVSDFLTAKAAHAPKTILFYQTPLVQFSAHLGARWPPTPESIDAFLLACKQRGLKESSIEAYYKALKIWLAWLVKRGKLDSNPIDLAEKPPKPRLLPRTPRRADLQKLFVYLEAAADKGRGNWLDIRALALWSLALDTGLRVGELAALTVKDIFIEKNYRSAFIRGDKTHSNRVVVFHRSTAKDVKRWLKALAMLPLPPDLDSLFIAYCRGRWGSLTTWGMRQDLDECCRRAGIPHLTPHQFRNAYAVYSLRNRADLLDIQRQMGHSNIATTGRYLMVDDEGRAERHNASSPRGKL
jgi:site-specific recombinase XerD